MTHFPARRDALVQGDEESVDKCEIRACTGCGRDFVVIRPWQRQCSQRCRQRAYVERKSTTPLGYYGARCEVQQFEEGEDPMATTKWARYRFVVKESATEAREVREGFVDLVADPFIVAEPYDNKPQSEYPLESPDFLSLELSQGISLDEAQRIADFLNNHVQYLAITQFGDVEDATRDVRQSEHERQVDLERFAAVVEMFRNKVKANDAAETIEAVKAVESVIGDLIAGWSKAINMSREILAKFGQGEDQDA